MKVIRFLPIGNWKRMSELTILEKGSHFMFIHMKHDTYTPTKLFVCLEDYLFLLYFCIYLFFHIIYIAPNFYYQLQTVYFFVLLIPTTNSEFICVIFQYEYLCNLVWLIRSLWVKQSDLRSDAYVDTLLF